MLRSSRPPFSWRGPGIAPGYAQRSAPGGSGCGMPERPEPPVRAVSNGPAREGNGVSILVGPSAASQPQSSPNSVLNAASSRVDARSRARRSFFSARNARGPWARGRTAAAARDATVGRDVLVTQFRCDAAGSRCGILIQLGNARTTEQSWSLRLVTGRESRILFLSGYQDRLSPVSGFERTLCSTGRKP